MGNGNNNGKPDQILSSPQIIPQQQQQHSPIMNIFNHKDGGIMEDTYGTQSQSSNKHS